MLGAWVPLAVFVLIPKSTPSLAAATSEASPVQLPISLAPTLAPTLHEWLPALSGHGLHVLDLGVGCLRGNRSNHLTVRRCTVNVNVTGIAPACSAGYHAECHHTKYGSSGDAHQRLLPYADESFDLVYSNSTLSPISSPPSSTTGRDLHMISEAMRVLRPCGIASLPLFACCFGRTPRLYGRMVAWQPGAKLALPPTASTGRRLSHKPILPPVLDTAKVNVESLGTFEVQLLRLPTVDPNGEFRFQLLARKLHARTCPSKAPFLLDSAAASRAAKTHSSLNSSSLRRVLPDSDRSTVLTAIHAWLHDATPNPPAANRTTRADAPTQISPAATRAAADGHSRHAAAPSARSQTTLRMADQYVDELYDRRAENVLQELHTWLALPPSKWQSIEAYHNARADKMKAACRRHSDEHMERHFNVTRQFLSCRLLPRLCSACATFSVSVHAKSESLTRQKMGIMPLVALWLCALLGLLIEQRAPRPRIPAHGSLAFSRPGASMKLMVLLIVTVDLSGLTVPERQCALAFPELLELRSPPLYPVISKTKLPHLILPLAETLMPGLTPETLPLYVARLEELRKVCLIAWGLFLVAPSWWWRTFGLFYAIGALAYATLGYLNVNYVQSHPLVGPLLFVTGSVLAVPGLAHNPRASMWLRGKWLVGSVIAPLYLCSGLSKMRYDSIQRMINGEWLIPILTSHDQIITTSVSGLRELILHAPHGYGVMLMSWGNLAFEFFFPLAVMLMAWRGSLPSLCLMIMLVMALGFHATILLMMGPNFVQCVVLDLMALNPLALFGNGAAPRERTFAIPPRRWTDTGRDIFAALVVVGWFVVQLASDYSHDIGLTPKSKKHDPMMPISEMSMYATASDATTTEVTTAVLSAAILVAFGAVTTTSVRVPDAKQILPGPDYGLACMRLIAVRTACATAILVFQVLDGILAATRCVVRLTTTAPQQAARGRRQAVVIVGGSFAGLRAQSALSDDFDVTVVDYKDYFEYLPGVLRLFVRPSHHHALTFPIPRQRNKFVLARVTEIGTTAVKIEGDDARESIPFDYLLLACGSTYPCPPVRPTSGEAMLPSRRQRWKRAAADLAAATSVLVIGGGPVGVELAAEIASAHPSMRLTLVTAAQTLCAEMPPQVGVVVRRWLEERGVTLHFEERAEPASDSRGCMLSDGKLIVADIVYQCTGGAPETSALRANWTLDRRGHATVNKHLQLLGAATETPHIYAIGDMIALPADATCTHTGLGHTAELNAHVAAENVRRSSGGNALLEYPDGAVGSHLAPRVYCISLGEADGVLVFNGLVASGMIAAIAKRLIEWTKVAACEERLIGVLGWRVADAGAAWMSRHVLPPPPRAVASPDGRCILLFDGVCLLCNTFVHFLIDRDADEVFAFASLQSDVGLAYLRKAGLPLDVSTVVLIDDAGVHTRSTAALRALMRCGRAYIVLHAALIWLPRPLRDLGYRIVAALRYRLFGKDEGETCRRMTRDMRRRFTVEMPSASPISFRKRDKKISCGPGL